MFNIFANVSVQSDKTKEIGAALKELMSKEVMVGVPQEESSRSGAITNAELAYIHTHGIRERSMINEMDVAMDAGKPYSKAYKMYLHSHGSPLWHSPPRPIIEPAIEDNKEVIAEILKEAAKKALDGDIEGANKELEKAGLLGQNIARGWFTNPKNNWPQNAPETVEEKGSDKPLIDTGELRKSITYVVRKK